MSVNTNNEFPVSIFDAMEQYALLCDPNRFSMLRTAMERYAVAGWGGPISQRGQNVSSEAQAFLKTLSIDALNSTAEAVERGCDLLGLDSKGKNKNRSYAKKFLEFCKHQAWLPTASSTQTSHKQERKFYRFKNTNGEHRTRRVSSTGAKPTTAHSLGTQQNDYIITEVMKVDTEVRLSIWYLAVKCAAQIEGVFNLFVFERLLGNPKLRQDLDYFAEYLGEAAIANGTLHKVLQMLSYSLRVGGVPLAELSLTKLVPLIKLTYTEEDFLADSTFNLESDCTVKSPEAIAYTLETHRNIAQRRIKQAAKQLLGWVDQYLDYLDQKRIDAGAKDGLADSTKRLHLDALIRLAKYVYKSETNSKTFSDIEIVNKLREKRDSLPINRAKQKARVAARCMSWEQAVQVVELQRERADQRDGMPQVKPNGKTYPIKRKPMGIAKDVQKVVILLLMMLIPSDRQQTYRRLQFRESLKIDEVVDGAFILWGDVVGNVFIPKAKLNNPDKARWWVALYVFKTVERYDFFWYPLPNQQFKDGKRFYEYLEMWFFGLEDIAGKWPQYYKGENAKWQGYIDEDGNRHGWRAVLQPQHDCAFSMPKNRSPFDIGALNHLVRSTFIEFTPKVDDGRITPVTPHSFRTMLASYTDGKITPAEEASMAYCEHHSVELRRNTYTFSDNMRKIADAIMVMDRINHELFLERPQVQQVRQRTGDVDLVEAETLDSSSLFPKSVFDALQRYAQDCDKNRFSMLRTAIERFAVAGWDGPKSQPGKKVAADAQEFLKTLPLDMLRGVLEAVDRGCKHFNLASEGTRKNRSYVNKFLEYCKEQGWLPETIPSAVPPERNQPGGYRFRQVGQRRATSFSSTGAGKVTHPTLGNHPTDYITIAEQQILGNPELHKELNGFEDYLDYLENRQLVLYLVRQMLGYQHRVEGVPLAELRLDNLIPFIKLNYTEADFGDDPVFALRDDGTAMFPREMEHRLAAAESLARQKLERKAKEVCQWVDKYFDWFDQCRVEVGAVGGSTRGTKEVYIQALIKVSQYLYRTETFSKDFADVAIINQLREKISEFPSDRRQRKARVGARCITWEEVIEVIEMQRQKADVRHMLAFHSKYTKTFYAPRRRANAIAYDIQKVLILLLLTLIPPDRQQSYRNLQFRSTLRIHEQTKGAFILCGHFVDEVLVPRNKMENPSQAQWWIALYEFKNVEQCGPFWYPIPNQQFKDGKTMYEYLEMWFFGLKDTEGKWPQYYKKKNANWQGFIDEKGRRHGWRAALKPAHGYVFSTPQTQKTFTTRGFSALVRNIFIRFTQELERGEIVAVTPHSFRTMLATYTAGKLTPTEEESIAYCEHHSVAIRRTAYTLHNNMEQIAPAVEVMERINNNLFLSRKRQD